MATTTAMADGNGDGNGLLQWQRQRQRQRQWSRRRRRRWQQQWQWQRPWRGQPLQRKGCLFMCWQFTALLDGRHLASTPMDTRKVHSPALHHGGDTAKSVCSPSRGRVPDSSPWIVFCLYFTTTVSLLKNPLFASRIIQALKNPVNLLMLYLLHSSKNPFSLLTIYPSSYCTFCQGKPEQGLQLL
jgi:hypothetical protein